MLLGLIVVLLVIVGLMSIRVVNEWQEGIVLTLGRYSRKLSPGINFIIPLVESAILVDKRITTVDIPKQEVITKDNVSVMVNGVVYFRVEDVEKAVLKIDNYRYAVAQYSQTALRDIIGEVELDELLTNREEIAERIMEVVDKETDEWGVDITAIKLQDIELPENMKRAMARQAEAEREKRAKILLSEGEIIAAENLAKAADKIAKSAGALHLRTLQALTELKGDGNTKYVLALPLEILEAFEKLAEKRKK